MADDAIQMWTRFFFVACPFRGNFLSVQSRLLIFPETIFQHLWSKLSEIKFTDISFLTDVIANAVSEWPQFRDLRLYMKEFVPVMRKVPNRFPAGDVITVADPNCIKLLFNVLVFITRMWDSQKPGFSGLFSSSLPIFYLMIFTSYSDSQSPFLFLLHKQS